MTLKNSLLWLPLSLPIFCVDIVQRGFATFASVTDLGVPHIKEAMTIFFVVLAISVLFFGFICDNFNARKVIWFSMIAAAVGMCVLPYTPWGFGLIFGSAAALIKVAPFSAPLKILQKKEALNISPQAAAKNLAGAIFTLFIGTSVVSFGWYNTTAILGLFVILCGYIVYRTVPNDKVEGWKVSIFKELAKDWKFWMIAVYFFLMCGWYYIAIGGFMPALIESGYIKQNAVYILTTSFLCSAGLRFVMAWLGDQSLFGFNLRLPLMWVGTFGMAASIPLTSSYPILSLGLFTIMSAIHTPSYWAYCKEKWGPTYIATVVSLGFFFMYLGAGVMYGKWVLG